MGYRSHVYKKGKRNKLLSERDIQANKRKSRIRVRVEHVLGSITNEQGGLNFKVIGIARNAVCQTDKGRDEAGCKLLVHSA